MSISEVHKNELEILDRQKIGNDEDELEPEKKMKKRKKIEEKKKKH